MTSHVPARTGEPASDPVAQVASGTVVSASGPPPASGLLRAALDAATEAVVVCRDADHTILLVNAAARELLPGLDVGMSALATPLGGLSRAVSHDEPAVTDRYDGRQVSGRRRRLDDRHYAWYLRDCTEAAARAAELTAERARTARCPAWSRHWAGPRRSRAAGWTCHKCRTGCCPRTSARWARCW
ncbi:MAG TPA: hypothetical protein VFH03_00730 [Actinoplanes sp.]|nr:hypothetical protein [Actinoplanes sp.]